MATHIGNPTFGIKGQALAVLAILSQYEPHWAEYNKEYSDYAVGFETRPWYNGRERGIIISMTHFPRGKMVLHFAIFEHRNSDQLCVLKWETDHFYYNSPDAENAIEEAYGKDKTKWDVSAQFPCNDIKSCVDWIEKEMENWYKLNKPKPVASKKAVKV
jgi:hypothetical protein